MRAESDPRELLRTFYDVSLRISRERDIEGVLAGIVEHAIELTGSPAGAAVSLTSEGTVETVVSRGVAREEIDELLKATPLPGPDSDRYFGVAIEASGRTGGAIFLRRREAGEPFTDMDEELVQAVAALAGVAIENARLLEAERGRAERSHLLRAISSKVRASLRVDEVLAATVEALGHDAGVDRCFIRLTLTSFEPTLGPIVVEWDAPGIGKLATEPERQYSVSSLAARSRSTQWSADIVTDERLLDAELPSTGEGGEPLRARAALSTPLEWGQTLLGVVTFHYERPHLWTESDVALIEAAAREVSIAIQHANEYADALETAEKLRELDRMRTDFVSMVSHELRSPMTVVAGIAEILDKREDRLTEAQRREFIDTLGREARRLARLVSEALDLESIDRGRLVLQLAPVDVGELAQESISDGGVADRTETTIEDGDLVIDADRDRVKQVLLNLLSNAAKFSEEDSPITVIVRPQGASILVAVRDRGPGIKPEDRDRLFQRFTRLVATSGAKPGSGLGLYLSKKIVEQHRGDMWVESEPGQGATFWFRLPRAAERS